MCQPPGGPGYSGGAPTKPVGVTPGEAFGEDHSTDAMLDALARYRDFELYAARACSGESDVAAMLSSTVAENERYAETVDAFGRAVGLLVKAVRHPYPNAAAALSLLIELLGEEALHVRRAVETDRPGLMATMHLSCDVFGTPLARAEQRRRPPRRFWELLDDGSPYGAPARPDPDAERLREARRIVVLRSAPYLTVPSGEYVVLQRLLALDDPQCPDRRLGLPRWALRALFGIGSKVAAEIEGSVTVASLVLAASAD